MTQSDVPDVQLTGENISVNYSTLLLLKRAGSAIGAHVPNMELSDYLPNGDLDSIENAAEAVVRNFPQPGSHESLTQQTEIVGGRYLLPNLPTCFFDDIQIILNFDQRKGELINSANPDDFNPSNMVQGFTNYRELREAKAAEEVLDTGMTNS
jgi:hypothetical protein